MRKATKSVVLLLTLLLLMSTMLIGCKDTTTATEEDKTAETTKAAETAKTEEAAEATEAPAEETLEQADLIYWITGPGKQKDSDKVWEVLNQYLEEQIPNTTVEFNVIPPGEYADKWARAMAAQEQVDVAWIGWMINVNDEVNKGALMPLDDLIDSYGQELLASLGQDVIDVHRINDGHIYQIPSWQGLVGNRNGIYFPAELANLVSPTYVEDFQNVLYANWESTAADGKQKAFDFLETYLEKTKEAGKLAQGYNVHTLYNWYVINGISRIRNTGAPSGDLGEYAYIEHGDNTFTVKSMQESDFVKTNYQYVADWFDKGYIRSDIASVDSIPSGADTWAVDKTWENSYNVTAHMVLTDSKAAELTAACGFDVSVAFTNPVCEYILGTATGTGIPTTSKNPERAMMLINLLYSDAGVDVYRTYVYGIEGEHWVDNGDGTATTLEGDGGATEEWAYGNWTWVIGTCMNTLVTQTDTVGYYQTLKDLESTALVNPITRFSFDNSPVETIKAQLDSITGEYGQILYRGYLGSDWEGIYNEYIQKMKDAGLDEYLAEVQKQLDAFVAETNAQWK